jgi:hypothetical protein
MRQKLAKKDGKSALQYLKSLGKKWRGVWKAIEQTNTTIAFPYFSEVKNDGKFGFGKVNFEITGDSLVHNIRMIKVYFTLFSLAFVKMYPVFFPHLVFFVHTAQWDVHRIWFEEFFWARELSSTNRPFSSLCTI